MSGGVGPTTDITFSEEPETAQNGVVSSPGGRKQNSSGATRGGAFLTFRHLNALAVAIVCAASGMISLLDLTFVVASFPYIYLLSRTAFPSLGPDPEPRVFDPSNRLLKIYVVAGAIVGLVLPAAYVFEGIVEGDKEGVAAAIPHVFLLASQVLAEGVFSGRFSSPIRAFVPVAYNSRRIFTLEEWFMEEMRKEHRGSSGRRLFMGRGLVVANCAFWSFNLFCFLLPVYLPRALRRYYCGGYEDSPSSSSRSGGGDGGSEKTKEN